MMRGGVRREEGGLQRGSGSDGGVVHTACLLSCPRVLHAVAQAQHLAFQISDQVGALAPIEMVRAAVFPLHKGRVRCTGHLGIHDDDGGPHQQCAQAS